MLLRALLVSALCAAAAPTAAAGNNATRPSVILHVIVDDLGWGDVAWHRAADDRAEHSTPHMLELAKAGIELNRHYVHKMCTPTRSSFLSGRLPVHVQMYLDNPESPKCGVPRNMTSGAAKLRSLGYKTHVAGKWCGRVCSALAAARAPG